MNTKNLMILFLLTLMLISFQSPPQDNYVAGIFSDDNSRKVPIEKVVSGDRIWINSYGLSTLERIYSGDSNLDGIYLLGKDTFGKDMIVYINLVTYDAQWNITNLQIPRNDYGEPMLGMYDILGTTVPQLIGINGTSGFIIDASGSMTSYDWNITTNVYQIGFANFNYPSIYIAENNGTHNLINIIHNNDLMTVDAVHVINNTISSHDFVWITTGDFLGYSEVQLAFMTKGGKGNLTVINGTDGAALKIVNISIDPDLNSATTTDDLNFLVPINATGDAYTDLVILQNSDRYLFSGNNFTMLKNSTVDVFSWNWMDYVVCDFDNDGVEEIAAVTYDSIDRYGEVSVFEPTTMEINQTEFTEIVSRDALQVFDYNNDSFMDLLITDSASVKILDIKNSNLIYESHEYSVVTTGLGDFSGDGVFDTIIGEKYDITGFETDRTNPTVSEVVWTPKHPTQRDWELTIYAKIEDQSRINAIVNYSVNTEDYYSISDMNLIDTENNIWSAKISGLKNYKSIQFEIVVSDAFGNSNITKNGTAFYSVDVLSEQIWNGFVFTERLFKTDIFTYHISSTRIGVGIYYKNIQKFASLDASNGNELFNVSFDAMSAYNTKVIQARTSGGTSLENLIFVFYNTTIKDLNITIIDGLSGAKIRSKSYVSNASVIDVDFIYRSAGSFIYLTLSNNTVSAITESTLGINSTLDVGSIFPGFNVKMSDTGKYVSTDDYLVIYAYNGTLVHPLIVSPTLSPIATMSVDVGNAIDFITMLNTRPLSLSANVIGTPAMESIFVISYGFQFKVFSIDWESGTLYSCVISNAQLDSLTLYDFNDDNTYEIIIGYNNGTVGVLTAAGNVLGSFSGKPKAISAVRFISPSNSLYAVIRSTDGNAYVINTKTNNVVTDFETPTIPSGLFEVRDFNGDNEYELLCITSDNPVVVSLLTDLTKYYVLHVSYTAPLNNAYQSSILPVEVSLKNYFDEYVLDAKVTIIVNNSISVYYNPTQLLGNNYSVAISTTGWDIGIYTMIIHVEHDYYDEVVMLKNFVLRGYIKVEMFLPDFVMRGENISGDLYVTDLNQMPYDPTNVTLALSNEFGYYKTIVLNESQYGTFSFNISTDDIPVGTLTISATAYSPFADSGFTQGTVIIKDTLNITVQGPGITSSPVVQGQTVHLKVNLRTSHGTYLAGGNVVLSFAGKLYTCSDMRNGSYMVEIATTNWIAGPHPFIIQASHKYGVSTSLNSSLFIMGEMNLDVVLSHDSVYQNSNLRILVYATDKFGSGIQNAEIHVSLAGHEFLLTHVDRNIYSAIINVGNLYHGTYNLTVSASAQGFLPKTTSVSLEVIVQMPNVSMDATTFSTLMGISILISIIGLYIYYQISRRIRLTKEKDIEDLEKSLRSLDILYIVLLIISGILGGAAYLLANAQLYSISISIAALLLLLIIALYAIWLYRDVNSFMAHEKFRIIRAILGLWHLLLVPIIIYGIFVWGHYIEWFSYYVLGDIIRIGNLIVPKLYINLMGTYVTTMVLVVFLTYKNIIEDIHRIKSMKQEGTPSSVIISEKIRTISKALDSIRIKMLIFLAILGVSIVTTMDVFRFMQLGIIVLTPLLLIVVLPWIVYKLMSVFKVFRRIIMGSEKA